MNEINPLSARESLADMFSRFIPNMVRGAQLDFFAGKSITQSQFLVLLSCHAHGRCPMGQLARDMHVSLPTMTGLVDRLVVAEYLTRVASSHDRRQVLIELTDKGRAFVMEHRGVVARRFKEVSQALSDQDVEDMLRVLTRLLSQFKTETPS